MGLVVDILKKLKRVPGMQKARHVAEQSFAPYLRADLEAIRDTVVDISHQLADTRARLDELAASLDQHLPTLLNTISSQNGATRLLRRELAEVERTLESVAGRQQGVEDTVNALVLHEIRYGAASTAYRQPPKVIDPIALDRRPLRLNLGCGHIILDDYVNVDVRVLPGVDVVAAVDDLPVAPNSVDEIFSAHLLERFPEEQLRRQLLPYWHSLLMDGGKFTAVVPDLMAMVSDVNAGKIEFEQLRHVAYGGQEYEGDFHHNAFTPESLSRLLEEAGFVDVELVERARPNGDCLEFELAATRPVARAR